MAGGKTVTVLFDQELYLALEYHAGAAGLTISQTIRDLLRYSLGVVPTERSAGWREGYTAAFNMIQQAVMQGIASIPPNYPGGE
jgi:hypothetical protein